MINIGPFEIRQGGDPFIIAEAGINHNGELEKAFKMIEVAKDVGASAIKFQTFKAKEFVKDKSEQFTYQSQGRQVTESMLKMFERYEFSRDAWFKIKEECDAAKILFLSTPQNKSDLQLLKEIGIPAIKIGSDDFINIPYVKHCAATGLPLIMSCGMSDLGEVHISLEAAGAFDGAKVILLLCTSEYPCPPESVNLSKLVTLQKAFPGILTGFSDHTQGPLASSLAAGLGAVVFEKHFTLDNDLPGPDHWFSENPESLKRWVDSIQTAVTIMGSPAVEPTKAEKSEMRTLARRSIISLRDIKAGEVLSEENLGLMRPGDGIEPIYFEQLLGKKAKRDISDREKLKWGDFS